MSWLACTIGGTDVSTFVKAFSRDGSVCDVSYVLTIDEDTRGPTVQPAQEVTLDVDGVRWFTGYVVSVTAQRSRGNWVNRIYCDHKALKRLRDYFWPGRGLDIDNNFVQSVLGLCFERAGASLTIDTALQPAFSEIEMPPYTWQTGTSAYDVVVDCMLFGMVQMNPLPDGSCFFQKMRPATYPTDITSRTVLHERRVDDAYFRTDALVFGFGTEVASASGSNPYGYHRTMIVANPHLISSSWSQKVADQLLAEYNSLTTVEKNTIATRERINLGDSTEFQSDKYTVPGVVMRTNVSANDKGFLQALTMGEKCPKIFGFEKQQPPVVARLIMHNYAHVLISHNFFDVTQEAEWTEITPAGIGRICSLAIDEDDHGAWLVTRAYGASGADANGVWRTSSIQGGSWSLVLSQTAASTLGKAKKLELGWTRLDFNEVRSCISFGNGFVCVPEVNEVGIFGSLDPTAVFTSGNGGGTWTISVPSDGPLSPSKFWCNQFLVFGNHQIDWDGSNLVIAGADKNTVTGWKGCLATSGDGINWSLTDQSATYVELRSCNVIGANTYSRDENFDQQLLLPATLFGPNTTANFGYKRFEFNGALAYISNTATGQNTELYTGVTKVFTSGGKVAVASVFNGGSGYSIGDVLTLATPEGGTSATVQVTTTSGGAVTGIIVLTGGTGYSPGVKSTTGGSGTGCTISVDALWDYTRPFGIARMYGASEFIFASNASMSSGSGVVSYWLSGTQYDRTGNLFSAIGGDWEGTLSVNNDRDDSAIEAIATAN